MKSVGRIGEFLSVLLREPREPRPRPQKNFARGLDKNAEMKYTRTMKHYTTPQITIPQPVPSGTSGESLYEQYSEALAAVRAAIEVVRRNGPNMRDYYAAGTWSAALEEHESRIMKLQEIADELSYILEWIVKVYNL